MSDQLYCALCSGECEDDGNSVEIKSDDPTVKVFVCAACAKAEPGLIEHVGKVKS